MPTDDGAGSTFPGRLHSFGPERLDEPGRDGRVVEDTAIELDPAYVDVAVKRWQVFTGNSAILEGDERSFAEIAAERRGDKN